MWISYRAVVARESSVRVRVGIQAVVTAVQLKFGTNPVCTRVREQLREHSKYCLPSIFIGYYTSVSCLYVDQIWNEACRNKGGLGGIEGSNPN